MVMICIWQVIHFWKVWYLQSAQQQRLQKEETQEKISERKAV